MLINSKKSNLTLHRFIRLLPWIWLIGSYFFSVFVFYRYGTHLLDSDKSSEMVLAAQLNREHGILSANWFYSTELRILNTQLVYKIGLALFSSWHLARTFSVAFLLLILLACYFFMTHSLQLQQLGVWGAIALVLPFSTTYEEFALYGLYYIPYLCISFATLGMIFCLAAPLKKQTDKIKKGFIFAALIAVCFVAGLGGIRQLIACYGPLFLTATILLWLSARHTDKLREIPLLTEFPLFIISGFALVFNMLGYLINTKILHNIYSFRLYEVSGLNPFSLLSFLDNLGNTFLIFGCEGCAELFSLQGIKCLSSFLLSGSMVLACIVCFVRWKSIPFKERFILLFCGIAIFANALACQLTNLNHPRYLIPAVMFAFPAFHIIWSHSRVKNRIVRYLPILLLAGCVTLQSFCLCLPRFASAAPSNAQRVTAWLTENNYTQGYATFWNGNIITELSNGQVEIWAMPPTNTDTSPINLSVYDWLQNKAHMQAPPQGAVFLLLRESECSNPGVSQFAPEDHLAYRENGYAVYTYENAEELFALAAQ